MSSSRRVFLLLGVYERLTERESGALRRGDVDFALVMEERKVRVAAALAAARRNSGLSRAEIDVFTRRVRTLEIQENRNLAFLREEAARVHAGIEELKQAAQRTRCVRRGYVGGQGVVSEMSGAVLGLA